VSATELKVNEWIASMSSSPAHAANSTTMSVGSNPPGDMRAITVERFFDR